MLSQDIEYLSKVSNVNCRILAENEYIVDVYEYTDVQEWAKNVVHQSLKSRWSVGESKGHYEKLVVSISCAKSCLRYVFGCDTNLMVACPEVDLAEDLSSMESV